MNKKTLLHRLRNAFGFSKIEIRDARLQAAEELERLYKVEQKLQGFLKQARKVRNYSNIDDVFKAIPVSVLLDEVLGSTKEICQHCSITPCACELHG